jgi:alpha,alpha-trehalose phosphorylase
VLALYAAPGAFTDEEKARDFAYYEAITVRDSSLSAATQAIIAAETGHLELAFDYLREAALMDLCDLNRNTGDGLHMASLAGGWLALVAGFGGLRDQAGDLRFAPRLPDRIARLRFRLNFRGRRLAVELRGGEARYTLEQGDELALRHEDEPLVVRAGEPQARAMVRPPERPRPRQPPGREPRRR